MTVPSEVAPPKPIMWRPHHLGPAPCTRRHAASGASYTHRLHPPPPASAVDRAEVTSPGARARRDPRTAIPMTRTDPAIVHDARDDTIPPRDVPAHADLRVDMPVGLIGFTPAPHTVHLVPIPRGATWTLLGMTEPGKPPEVARWLDAHGPVDIEIGHGLAPRSLRADFDTVPAAWQALFASMAVRTLVITPEGTASVFAQGDQDTVERYVEGLKGQAPDATVRIRPALGSGEIRLTRRQQDVLSAAVALGYYEVPHQVSLRELAAEMGVSLGAVSELLRRAESQIVRRYVDKVAEQRVAEMLDEERA